MQLCIFEDQFFSRLQPLVYYRPVYDLLCGIRTLREKILNAYPGIKYSLHCRAYLENFVKENNPGIQINEVDEDETLFINGRLLPPVNLAEIIPVNGEEKIFKKGEIVIAARISRKNLNEIKKKLNNTLSSSDFDNFPSEEVELNTSEYIWDLIYSNKNEIINDFKYLVNEEDLVLGKNLKGNLFEGVHLIQKDNIFINEGANVKSGVVLDASGGPIYIEKDVLIHPNAVIEGPFYIGKNSLIKSCSTIYENVSIGNTCKIGGEIEDAVFLPYSNKQHSGFIGHAYIGSWVNIGADTNCSDLKNNYSSIKAYVNGEEVNTGKQFLGLMMGDHSKTAINTMFNTGTTAGFSCNIFGAGFPEKYIPSFSWGGSRSVTVYDVKKSVETAKKVLKRRNKEMSGSEEGLFEKIFELTNSERIERGYPY